MSTKVKIGIAAGIVVALVGLIIIDQRSGTKAPPSTEANTGSNAPEKVTGLIVEGDSPGVDGGPTHAASNPGTSITVEQPRTPAPAPGPETYVVQQGETACTIAEKKYGDQQAWTLIAKANPDVNLNRLRVGQKLILPPKENRSAPAETPSTIEENNGSKTYTVQVGETLEKIARKVYNSTKPTVLAAIKDANPQIGTGDLLKVGMKLALPVVDVNPAPRVESNEAAAGRKTVKVASGDSLWKIATKHKGTRGVHEMVDAIVAANSDKLTSSSDVVRVGWTLVIPD